MKVGGDESTKCFRDYKIGFREFNMKYGLFSSSCVTILLKYGGLGTVYPGIKKSRIFLNQNQPKSMRGARAPLPGALSQQVSS